MALVPKPVGCFLAIIGGLVSGAVGFIIGWMIGGPIGAFLFLFLGFFPGATLTLTILGFKSNQHPPAVRSKDDYPGGAF
jgi:hypothetical protein